MAVVVHADCVFVSHGNARRRNEAEGVGHTAAPGPFELTRRTTREVHRLLPELPRLRGAAGVGLAAAESPEKSVGVREVLIRRGGHFSRLADGQRIFEQRRLDQRVDDGRRRRYRHVHHRESGADGACHQTEGQRRDPHVRVIEQRRDELVNLELRAEVDDRVDEEVETGRRRVEEGARPGEEEADEEAASVTAER